VVTIYKYPAPIDDEFTVEMPRGAQVLSVAIQDGIPCMWALVNPKEPLESRRFHWRGTGHPANLMGRFVGTVLMHGGALVFHLFEATAP
jgi:hypothetical protein